MWKRCLLKCQAESFLGINRLKRGSSLNESIILKMFIWIIPLTASLADCSLGLRFAPLLNELNSDMFRRLAPRSQSIARLCSNEHSTSFSFGGTGIRPYSMKKSDVHKHRQFDVQEEVAWTPPEKGKGKLNTSSTISGEGSSGGGVFADLDRGEIVFAYFEYYPPDQTL